MTPSILVVDDKLNVQKLLTDFLTGKGYQIYCASNGREALLQLKKNRIDLVLLDIMMPQMDGYEFIVELRRYSEIPVIMITAKQQEADLVKGFELGADDYITKPFKINELLVRVKAVLKRTSVNYSESTLIKVANLTLDKKSKELRIDNNLVELTQVELTILGLLMNSVEKNVTKAELCIHLIEEGYSGSESTLKIHVRNLRSKLALINVDQIIIESVFGIGYRLKKNYQ